MSKKSLNNNDEKNQEAIKQFHKRLKNLGIEEKNVPDGWPNVTETGRNIMSKKGLTGLKRAWLEVLIDAHHQMLHALKSRKNSWGILVQDDINALLYQIADARFYRARVALSGKNLILFAEEVKGKSWGDITKKSNERFMRKIRNRAKRAKSLLFLKGDI